MRANIAATKTNLLKTKKTLEISREGHDLLDQKRQILMTELSTIIHTVDKLEEDVFAKLQEAYGLVDKAVVSNGRNKLEDLSFAIDIQSNLSISSKRVMGVSIPSIELSITENPPFYSPYGVSFYADEVVAAFKDLLGLLSQLAEKKIALLRLAKEFQKTMRKVNALEKIHIPFYVETLKSIGDRIDEESRESFATLKTIKKRLRS